MFQAQGKPVVPVCKQIGVTEQTDFRWRKAYGGLRMDQAKRLKSLEKENGRLKKLVADLSLDNQILKEVSSGNFQARRSGEEPWYGSESGSGLSESVSVGPAACWDRLDRPNEESDRFPRKRDNWCSGWWSWPARTVGTATGGSRRCFALEGWKVNPKGVERLWRQEGLKVPSRQPKRRRLWLHDGSCVRLRPTHRNHVWSYAFMHERTQEGRAFRLLTILDEHSL